MTLDELKQLLTDGKITKEQFLAMAKVLDPNYTEEPENDDNGPESGAEAQESGAKPGDNKTPTDIEKLVQSAVDRACNKLGNENKRLKQQLEQIKREKLTDDERKQMDLEDKEKTIAERERALTEKENRLYAIKAIKKAGLDDGSDASLELVDFVMGSDEAAIDSRVCAFSELVKKFVKGEVDKTFRANGRNPGKGSGGAAEDNPWSKDHWNITKQWSIEANDPERAKALKAAAGVK